MDPSSDIHPSIHIRSILSADTASYFQDNHILYEPPVSFN